MGLEKDLPPGEHLVTLFRPFLEHLAMSNLSPKTIQKQLTGIRARPMIMQRRVTPTKLAPVQPRQIIVQVPDGAVAPAAAGANLFYVVLP